MARFTSKVVVLFLLQWTVLIGPTGAEVFGVFEGHVSGARSNATNPLPSGIEKGSRVIGCFRYWPGDARPPVPTRIGGWKYEFRSGSPRSLFALAVGSHLWRSGGRFLIYVGNDRPATSKASAPKKDDFGLRYDTVWYPSPIMPRHAGIPPAESGYASLFFGSQSPPVDFLSSSELPESADDFDLFPDLFIAGSVGAQIGRETWSFHYRVDVDDMVIRSGGQPFDRLHDAARLCVDPNISRQEELNATREIANVVHHQGGLAMVAFR